MRLATVYTDHIFNQGYHVSFNGLLRQQSAVDRGISVKPGLGHLGHWQTVQTQTQIRRRRKWRLTSLTLFA